MALWWSMKKLVWYGTDVLVPRCLLGVRCWVLCVIFSLVTVFEKNTQGLDQVFAFFSD